MRPGESEGSSLSTETTSLFRWWVGAFGGLAAWGAGSLVLSDASRLKPVYGVVEYTLLVVSVVIAIEMILMAGSLVQAPRIWESLSDVEREVCSSFGMSLAEISESSRSVARVSSALDVKQRVIEYWRQRQTVEALADARAKLRTGALVVLALLIGATVVRTLPSSQAGCESSLGLCPSVAVDQAPKLVEVELVGDAKLVGDSQARILAASRGRCVVPDRFGALLVGGTWLAPVVQFELPGCGSGIVALIPGSVVMKPKLP